MIVLDTNVLSEIMRSDASPVVMGWVAQQSENLFHTTVICETEILQGIYFLNAGKKRTSLMNAAKKILNGVLAERILPLDRTAAGLQAEIVAKRRKMGRPIKWPDAQIAAITLANNAILATRDVGDFTGCGIRVVNPWDA